MIRGGKDKSCNSEKAEEKRLGWVDVQREGSLPEEEKRKRRNACIVCMYRLDRKYARGARFHGMRFFEYGGHPYETEK